MDEETTGQAAPEAPPGDTGAVAAVEAPPTETTADPSAPPPESEPGHPGFEAWIAADAERINAEVAATEGQETAAEVADPTATETVATTAAVPPPAPAPRPAQSTQTEFDEAAALTRLQERGYKVEAPAPPPDPYAELTGRLSPFVGTPEEYATTQAAALVQLPPEPTAYDAETVSAHEAAVKARNEAAVRLQQMNVARQITDVASVWGDRRALGKLGSALESLVSQHQIPPEKATRVTAPTAMTDAVNAVVETVTDRINAGWQMKFDAEVKKWQGEVARAKSDKSANNFQRMGAAPQAATGPGGRKAGPGQLYETIPGTDLPTEAAIQAMIRGDFANVDLSDR